ncbi:MAG TPA: glycosyltransferase [Acidimicrobiia bacterium]|nr:glycosyltransferase [Acidimicrobiia bacterium]
MARFAGSENDYSPLAAVDPGGPRLTVAVVIPAYNRIELLRRTLAGLMVQRGYPAHLLSVVVADDGSEEASTLALAVEEAAERLRITVVRQEREGYGAGRARNLGAAAARADVVLFVDADCLPDPELVAGHMAWHHRADNLVVVGSRQHVDSTGVSAEAITDGSIDIRHLVKGDDPPDAAFAPEDWRRTFYRRTADLRRGNEAFRALLTGNCSLRRDRFLEAGGFSADFRHWGGEDTELGWRLFSAGLFFVPANRAAIYHQQQEESHPEEGWRRAGRTANADLIRGKIPHRFYRRLTDPGPFAVPKVSWVVTTPAAPRAAELFTQMQGQSSGDWEACFPLDPAFHAADARLRRLPDEAGAEGHRLLRAVAAARGEYVALVSGAAGLHPLLLERVVRFLDASPRASIATVGYAGLDPVSADAAWGPEPLPAFVVARRREWSKVLPGAATPAEAWRRLTALSWERHLEEQLVTFPAPAGTVPGSVIPEVPERDRIVEAGRRGTGARAVLYRLGRSWRRRRRDQDDRPVLAHLGDARSREAVARLAPWARVETAATGAALVLGGGAVLDEATLQAVRAVDSPHLERAVLGAAAGDGPVGEWADFLGTCLFVAVATEADAAALRSWGCAAPLTVLGHPGEAPDRAGELLHRLRREV